MPSSYPDWYASSQASPPPIKLFESHVNCLSAGLRALRRLLRRRAAIRGRGRVSTNISVSGRLGFLIAVLFMGGYSAALRVVLATVFTRRHE